MNHPRPGSNNGEEDHNHNQEDDVREIHALTPPHPPVVPTRARRREAWDTGSHRSSSLSIGSEGALSENFTSMSREFNALVIAGSGIDNTGGDNDGGNNAGNNLDRIGEEEMPVPETNPLAIVPDSNPLNPVPSRHTAVGGSSSTSSSVVEDVSMFRVKKEEVESKISAWQTAKIAKVNNRFKREDAVINGWEGEQVQKATSWMKKVERKLEEKRAKALEKMQNEVAKARRKAEERRASAEAKRGTKVQISKAAIKLKCAGGA